MEHAHIVFVEGVDSLVLCARTLRTGLRVRCGVVGVGICDQALRNKQLFFIAIEMRYEHSGYPYTVVVDKYR